MRNKHIQENNNRKQRVYQVKIFSDMDIMIKENDPVRLLEEVLEGLDYKELRRAYEARGRNPKTQCSK